MSNIRKLICLPKKIILIIRVKTKFQRNISMFGNNIYEYINWSLYVVKLCIKEAPFLVSKTMLVSKSKQRDFRIFVKVLQQIKELEK